MFLLQAVQREGHLLHLLILDALRHHLPLLSAEAAQRYAEETAMLRQGLPLPAQAEVRLLSAGAVPPLRATARPEHLPLLRPEAAVLVEAVPAAAAVEVHPTAVGEHREAAVDADSKEC